MAQLLTNLPLGAKIKFGKHQINTETAQSIIWRVIDKNHSGYTSNSVTLITDKIIDLRAFDGKESSWGTDTIYGYCDYKVSNIRQWLNSDAGAGAWYVAQHDNDKTPAQVLHNTAYNEKAGFLYNFTTAEKSALLATVINAKFNEGYTTMTDKVFLPSLTEIMGTSSIDGSSRLTYFNNTNDVCAYPTEQVVTNTLASASYKPTSASSYWKYWTRNGGLYSASIISATGTVDSSQAYIGSVGIRPCINLSHNLKMSDAVDSDGCYTVLSNNVPTIDGTNSDLGQKISGFGQNYVVNDSDGDTITVTEYIDNEVVRSYVATRGATNRFSIEGNTWVKLANGTHTLKIVATDTFSEATRTYTFTKKVTSFVVQRTTPIASTTKPNSIIVTVVRNIPTEATFKVEACNNGFDASPIWEDITTKVIRGDIHDFTNSTKTASQWGVNIRVTVDRNGAEGACYITEIGGNFE